MPLSGSRHVKKRINDGLHRVTGYRLSRSTDAPPGKSSRPVIFVPEDVLKKVADQVAQATALRLQGSSAKIVSRTTRVSSTKPADGSAASDVDEFSRRAIASVSSRTMASEAKLLGLIDAVRYISECQLEGAVVECGVWRGGSMMVAAQTLLEQHDSSRPLFLYDTFDGSTEADVRRGMQSVGYPAEQIHYVKGKVQDTIPQTVPDEIALLRLDTDWYVSTAHELEHLYHRVVPGGVVIFGDYGYWDGARRAVDEYLERSGDSLLLARIGSGRMAVKPRP